MIDEASQLKINVFISFSITLFTIITTYDYTISNIMYRELYDGQNILSKTSSAIKKSILIWYYWG